MKQKLLSMFVFLLMAAVQGEAQVTLKIPQWQKFVKVNKSASFKKAPNVKSATLWADGGSTSVTFSWKKEEYMRKYYMPSFYQEICPVIKEVNGWYLVYICDGGQGLSVMEAYVQNSNTPRRYGIEYQFQDGHRETFWIEADSYKYPVNTIVI